MILPIVGIFEDHPYVLRLDILLDILNEVNPPNIGQKP